MKDDVADFLETNDIGTVGTDIFTGQLPADKSNCIALMDIPSPEPNKSIPYYTQAIDIWGRFTSYDAGYKKLQDIFDLLHRKENYSLENFYVYLSFSRGMINDNGKDAEGRSLFQMSLAFVYRDASEPIS